MITPISRTQEALLFDKLNGSASKMRAEIQNLKNMGLTQKDLLLRKIGDLFSSKDPTVATSVIDMMDKLKSGLPLNEASGCIKEFLPNDAAMKKTSVGIAIMAEGWSKPIVFKPDVFKAFIDDPAKVTTDDLWQLTMGGKPDLVFGGVGNSNIKPEQVKGGCSLSKKELSEKYVNSIKSTVGPVIDYLKEQGASDKDMAAVYAHSYCGIDEALRDLVESHNLRGFAVTPTEYTQYIKGTEMPATAEFPNGYIMADFNDPTIITRNISQIEDYANVYGKMVGKDNPLLVAGGGEHAFTRDAREALIGKGGSRIIPMDIMKDKYGIEIPAVNEKGIVTNASRDILERVDGNPYEQYRYAFNNFLPSSRLKEDLAQYDPQIALATVMYARLAQAGKIGK